MNTGDSANDGALPLFRQREYRFWFLTDTSLQISVMVGGFAFTLLAFTVTGDYTLSGLVGTLNSLVQAFMVIPGGLIADRIDRKKLIVSSGVMAAALDVVLIALLATGRLSTPMLLVIAMASGALSGLFANITNVVLPQVVGKSQLAEATAANQSRDAVLQLASSPLSGLLYGVSVALPFVVAVVFRVLQAVFGGLLTVDLSPGADVAEGRHDDASSPEGMGEGLRWYVRNRRPCVIQLLVVVVGMVLGMCGMAIVLDQQSRGTSALMLGVIQACQGIGMIVGAVGMMPLVKHMDGRCVLVATVAMFIVAFGAASFTHRPWALAMLGFCASVPLIPLNSLLGTYFVLLIPNDLRGRVGAVSTLLSTAASSVSSVMAGMLLDWVGYRATVLIPLALVLLVMIPSLFSSAIRRMPSFARMGELEPLR